MASCAARSKTRRGSTRYMNKLEVFSGILSNDSTANPGLQPFPSSLPSSKHAAAVVSDITFGSSDRNLFFFSSFGRLLRLEPSEASLLRWRLLWWRLGVPQQRKPSRLGSFYLMLSLLCPCVIVLGDPLECTTMIHVLADDYSLLQRAKDMESYCS